MTRSVLPNIKLEPKPAGLKFRAPKSALAKWDKTLRAAAKQPAEPTCCIDIMGEIGDSGWGGDCTTAAMVKAQLDAAGKSPVQVTLNSPGGDAFEGIAIYNLLRNHPGKVSVNVLGLAASAASVIAMAGDTVSMGSAAMMMIHSAWGLVMGNRNDMKEMAAMLDKIDTAVAELYASRSKQPIADVLAMMSAETWMTGPEAVANGFADVAIAEKKAKASLGSAINSLADDVINSISARVPVVLLGANQARPGVFMSAKSQVPMDQRKKGVVYL